MVNSTPPISTKTSNTSSKVVVNISSEHTIAPISSDDASVSNTPKPLNHDLPQNKTQRRKDEPSQPKFQLRTKTATEDDYDFIRARKAVKNISIKEGMMSLVKGTLGGGLVCIHESYMVCGLWTALVVNILLGFSVGFCMYELTKAAQKMYVRLGVPTLSYPDLAEATLEVGPFEKLRRFSRSFRHMVETVICIDLFGGCCVYQVMMARQIKQLVDASETLSHDWPTVRVYVLLTLLPCSVLSVFTGLHHLAPFSIVLDFFVVLLAVTTIWYGSLATTTHLFEMPAFKSFDGLFELVGVALYSMDGTAVTLTVENSLKDPRQFPKVLFGGMAIIMSLVVIIGFFGNWGYGEKCISPITLNFIWGSFSVNLKMSLIIMIYITYALNFWLPSYILWYYISSYHNPDKYWIWEKVYRMLFVLLTTFIAFCIPSNSSFLALLGSFCTTNMGFIFPGFIILNVDWEDSEKDSLYGRLWKAIAIMAFGFILFVIGTVANIWQLWMFAISTLS